MGTKENLLALLERRKGEYLSGEEIARLLSVSRTAVAISASGGRFSSRRIPWKF